jgi:hypothetical protein
MAIFLRLLESNNKESALQELASELKAGAQLGERIFDIDPKIFRSIQGAPFSYWVNQSALKAFDSLPSFKGNSRLACVTNPVGEDKRFYRLWWEIVQHASTNGSAWVPLAKGGKFSPFYFDLNLVVNWSSADGTYVGFTGTEHRPLAKPASVDYFFKPGLSWPQRTSSGLGMRVLPTGAVFSTKGPGAFVHGFDAKKTLEMLAICNSQPFKYLVNLQIAAADAAARSYEVGIINRTPFPETNAEIEHSLATLAHEAWKAKRELDSVDETSHAFALPAALRYRVGSYDPSAIETGLARIQVEIDVIAFDLYGFSDADRAAVQGNQSAVNEYDLEASADDEGEDDEDSAAPIDYTAGLLSWAVGVAFGRFDWRLATGERAAPAEPEPFDPLPAKSPGMLPDGAAPFHVHAGVLVDDQGHPHDLARLVEEVLARADVAVPEDVRRWLQKDFFPFHLQRYSKSRRKAPIYWPLSTTSGSYTLWVYYPSLTSQTLYTAINDYVDPKLKQVGAEVTALRNKGSARTRDDEKQFEALQAFELELIELRDTLLKLAPTYKPNHDDGVQISAAPLWPLFRHKPWQKVLKDTWAKLEKGDYDWAHLAMNYWPERVREKCKTDKSLAIAHGLEDLYIEPEAKPKKARGKKKAGGDE